jgi:hypothetical protein
MATHPHVASPAPNLEDLHANFGVVTVDKTSANSRPRFKCGMVWVETAAPKPLESLRFRILHDPSHDPATIIAYREYHFTFHAQPVFLELLAAPSNQV